MSSENGDQQKWGEQPVGNEIWRVWGFWRLYDIGSSAGSE